MTFIHWLTRLLKINYQGHTQDLERRLAAAEAEIEEQRKKLRASAKLSALGEMAGGIAHEINTPLAVITLNSEMLAADLREGRLDSESLSKYAESIRVTAFRIAKIVKAMRAFSKEGSMEPFREVSLQAIVDDTLTFCTERFMHAEVSLEVRGFSPGLLIECRPVEISQTLLNLLNNAFDVVTELETPRWIKIEVEEMEETVRLAVVDSGPGIPPEVRDKIMQPFFTTKESGKGVGLGLSISKEIVNHHGGKLELDSSGPHTRFMLTLPKRQSQGARGEKAAA